MSFAFFAYVSIIKGLSTPYFGLPKGFRPFASNSKQAYGGLWKLMGLIDDLAAESVTRLIEGFIEGSSTVASSAASTLSMGLRKEKGACERRKGLAKRG